MAKQKNEVDVKNANAVERQEEEKNWVVDSYSEPSIDTCESNLDDNWMADVPFNSKIVENYNTAIDSIVVNIMCPAINCIFLQTASTFFKSKLESMLSDKVSNLFMGLSYEIHKFNSAANLDDDETYIALEAYFKENLSHTYKVDKVVLIVDNLFERLSELSLKKFIDKVMKVKQRLNIAELKLIIIYEDGNDDSINSIKNYAEKRYQNYWLSVEDLDPMLFTSMFGKDIFSYYGAKFEISNSVYEYFFASFVYVQDICNINVESFLLDVQKLVNYCKYNRIGKVTKNVINKMYMLEQFAGVQRYSEELSLNDLERISIHEAGHAVVEIALYKKRRDYVISTYPGGNSSIGRTEMVDEQKTQASTEKEIKKEICAFLASQAAYNVTGMGSDLTTKSDYKNAYDLAYRCVMNRWENLSYFEKTSKLTSKEKKRINKEINKLLEKCLKNAEKIIKANEKMFFEFVKALKKERVLTGSKIKRIVKKYSK